MTEDGKKIRIASYNKRGRLTLDTVYHIMVDDEEWLEMQKEVYAEHAQMGLTATITELTEGQWHLLRMERAINLPEWESFEEPGCLPERIGCS